MKFPFYQQLDRMDCGPTCLRMIAKYYGRSISLELLRNLCQINREGVSLLGISEAAEAIGLHSIGVDIGMADLRTIDLPIIIHWKQNHFIVLYKIKNNKFFVADPAKGLIELSAEELEAGWLGNESLNILPPELLDGLDIKIKESSASGAALLLAKTSQFYDHDELPINSLNWSYSKHYLSKYKRLIFQLFAGLLVGSILQLTVPFFTQSIVDIGVNTQNLNFINIVLLAQCVLIVSRVCNDFIRSWILLHISTRVNISILTDFLIKLMKLPMSYFDSKKTGDIMQRMNDQKRIESFLTSSTLLTLFSIINLIVFSGILLYYSTLIFAVYLIGSAFYMLWLVIFLKSRRKLDYQRFDVAAQNQSNVIQLINGIHDIKLNNCEQQKRWDWERLQSKLFKINVKGLALGQYQQGGATFINELTNILITYLSAKAIINKDLTLGAMIAIQYVVGQLNNPIQQLLTFLQTFQDARISLERLNEIHMLEDEETLDGDQEFEVPVEQSIYFDNVSFTYPGAGNEAVVSDINLEFPQGKTTAIVGMSGSGKTTLLKLLLRYHRAEKGEIRLGDQPLSQINYKAWRNSCGIVMQDSYIFSDSIENNIALGDEVVNRKKLRNAIKIANIEEFVKGLPLGLKTKIGNEGMGISQGQRQRILIARAIYKDPQFIFFDEATNSLDANNEKTIMENLRLFFQGRTVVVVAHRLSTVRDADNIIVLHNGEIVENGTHDHLTSIKGDYYRLVRNQLELGN